MWNFGPSQWQINITLILAGISVLTVVRGIIALVWCLFK
jgi:hypothetical protein